MSAPTCPKCGLVAHAAVRNAVPWIVDEDATLANGGYPVVRIRNPDRSGVVSHSDGRSCFVANIDVLFEAP